LLKFKFFVLSLSLVILNFIDFMITEIGVRAFDFAELNPLIRYIMSISPASFLFIKISVPVLICFFIYRNLKFKKRYFTIHRFRFEIDSFRILYLLNFFYLLVVLNNLIWLYREIVFQA